MDKDPKKFSSWIPFIVIFLTLSAIVLGIGAIVMFNL